MSSGPPSVPPRSVRSPRGALERVLVVRGSFLATWGNVFIQVRRGALELEAFDQVRAAIVRHKALLPRGTIHGLVVLTEPGATIPSEVVRARQRMLVAEFLKLPSARLTVIVVGEDVDASLLRSASRGVSPSHPHLRLFAQPEPACAWLSEQISADAEQIGAVVAEARTLAERELAGFKSPST